MNTAHASVLCATLASLAGAAGANDLSSHFGAVARGACGGCADGGGCAWDDTFESLALLPSPPGNSTPVIGGSCSAASVFGSLSAAISGPNTAGAVTDPIGGNSTTKLRAHVADPSVQWSSVFRYSPSRTSGGRFVFQAQPGQPLRVRADMYVNSIASLWTIEPTYVGSGFILSRVLWGGENSTAGIGLPVGPITDFHVLGVDPKNKLLGIYFPTAFPTGHPAAGQPVPVPLNSWFTVEHEFTAQGIVSVRIDLHDGAGPLVVFEGESFGAQVALDRIGWRGEPGAAGDTLYIDNLHIEGPAARCAGDANYDGGVNFADLNFVLAQFGQPGNLPGDVNGDGAVNFADLNIVLGAFGLPCIPS